MSSVTQLEAAAKSLAPVFADLIRSAVKSVRDELTAEIEKRDARIAELERLALSNPSPEEIAKFAAALIPIEKIESESVILDEKLKAAIDAAVSTKLDVAAKEIAATYSGAIPQLELKIGEIEKSIPEPLDADQIARKAASMVPAPQDGAPGIAPTADEVAAIFERRFSDLSLSWERQVREMTEKALDKIPAPKDGKDGRDAFEIDSFDLSVSDDGRTVTAKFQSGDKSIEKSVVIASLLDRGVFKKGSEYFRGDGVTYGGSFWICQKDCPEGIPGVDRDGWRLAVKRGNDGKDLRDNASTRNPDEPVKI